MASAIKNLGDLNAHMASRSYITGYSFSADDASVFARLGTEALQGSSSAPHAYRWALHISALHGSVVKAAPRSASVQAPASKGKPAAAVTDGDFDDMFGEVAPVDAKKPASNSVYEEDDGETEEERAANAARRERMAKAAALKAEVRELSSYESPHYL
jgi:hypothetical protein